MDIPKPYYGGRWDPHNGFQPLEKVSAYPDELTGITDACGHHCGIQNGKTGHCHCTECHGRNSERC